MQYRFELNSLSDTKMLANKIAGILQYGFIIALNGDLGSGKTTLTREILSSLGIKGTIKSPTYTLVEQYSISGFDLCHFDLYRFNDPDEWIYAGFDEYFHHQAICFIEWAENAAGLIPVIDWTVTISVIDENKRSLLIETKTDLGKQCLIQLTTNDAN